MPADVHAVAVMQDSFRNAADVPAAFENDGLDTGMLQQFQRGGQSRRASADDEGGFSIHLFFCAFPLAIPAVSPTSDFRSNRFGFGSFISHISPAWLSWPT